MLNKKKWFVFLGCVIVIVGLCTTYISKKSSSPGGSLSLFLKVNSSKKDFSLVVEKVLNQYNMRKHILSNSPSGSGVSLIFAEGIRSTNLIRLDLDFMAYDLDLMKTKAEDIVKTINSLPVVQELMKGEISSLQNQIITNRALAKMNIAPAVEGFISTKVLLNKKKTIESSGHLLSTINIVSRMKTFNSRLSYLISFFAILGIAFIIFRIDLFSQE